MHSRCTVAGVLKQPDSMTSFTMAINTASFTVHMRTGVVLSTQLVLLLSPPSFFQPRNQERNHSQCRLEPQHKYVYQISGRLNPPNRSQFDSLAIIILTSKDGSWKSKEQSEEARYIRDKAGPVVRDRSILRRRTTRFTRVSSRLLH